MHLGGEWRVGGLINVCENWTGGVCWRLFLSLLFFQETGVGYG